MRQTTRTRFSWISLVLILVFLVASLPASAQEAGPADVKPINADGVTEGMGTAAMAAPAVEKLEWSDTMPVLTPEQQKQLDASTDLVNRPGPARKGAETEAGAAPAPGSETLLAGDLSQAGDAMRAPGDAQIYRNTNFSGVIPANRKSNVMESSTAQNGKYAFFTGNWFAARSTDGGSNWAYVNPYNGFPNFCCDQVTTFDEARNTFYWLRMESPSNSVNRFRLGVSNDQGASFCNYDVAPSSIGFNNQWWDYPHIQLGADYLYMAWNMFTGQPPNDSWTRTIVLRWPLDSLSACANLNYDYYWTNSWFTFVPVQGADHVMYWASNYPLSSPSNRIAIWTWPENVGGGGISSVVRTVTAWNYTNRGQAICGSNNGNWAARTDDRLLTGARYEIQGSNLIVRGRNVLAWWWNVKQGGNFPRPYIDGAAFYEDTLNQVGGNPGRPLLWNTSSCYLYPSAAANKRGDLGMVYNYGAGATLAPAVGFAIADDYVAAPPSWLGFSVRTSGARPSDSPSPKWGDYNTVRRFNPAANTWVAGAHFINQNTNCSNCSSPVFFNFGRARDRNSWSYWQNK